MVPAEGRDAAGWMWVIEGLGWPNGRDDYSASPAALRTAQSTKALTAGFWALA